jgi:hypothetical protein
MFKTYYLTFEFTFFLMCSSKLSSQTGSRDIVYSLFMSLLIFWRSATLLSDSFYTIWGTICYKFKLGILSIYLIIFKATKATLKFPSPNNLINSGTRFFIIKSNSNSSLLSWNLVCSYSIAYSLTFQSLSFLRSSTSFLPTVC